MTTRVTGSAISDSTSSTTNWPVISPSGNGRLTRKPTPISSTATIASGICSSTRRTASLASNVTACSTSTGS